MEFIASTFRALSNLSNTTGQECNVMAEIILSRYEKLTRHRDFTHFTTNLSADEIENIYGPRVRSRLREMCNLIAFPEDARDKRK